MKPGELYTLLIPAVGGQGGGVLSEWIIDAAHAAGLVGHGTSIPGVAQRTGSTSYYVELYTGDEEDSPTFSLYPVPGALDALLAPELLEVGRAIELGFPSPERTTIIASTHRLYSIHERISTSGSVYPTDDLLRAAEAFSRRFIAFDALALAREHGTEANAILLGALAASEVLPIGADAYRAAIERKAVQVKQNLAGFELGRERVSGSGSASETAPGDGGRLRKAAPPSADGPRGDGDVTGLDPLVRDWPAALHPVLAHAIPRLIDYQDRAYALRYLERLKPFVAPDADVDVAAIVARWLAVWMTYEDAIRVADLKTRWARFERITHDARAPGAEIIVTDYLKPDLDEIYGVLPYRLVRGVARWAERRWPEARPTLSQHVKTTTISGYLRLWLLARCRRLRPFSYRAHEEHRRMERWLAAVARCAGSSADLAREVARAAQLVKGYGDVRRRMMGALDDLLDRVLETLELAAGKSTTTATALAARYRGLALSGPDGEVEAAALAREVVERMRRGDAGSSLELVAAR